MVRLMVSAESNIASDMRLVAGSQGWSESVSKARKDPRVFPTIKDMPHIERSRVSVAFGGPYSQNAGQRSHQGVDRREKGQGREDW